MAWIETIGENAATGLLKKIYRDAADRAGKVFNILKIQSQNPPTLRAGMGLYLAAMHNESPISRSLREMIATVVSRANDCHY